MLFFLLMRPECIFMMILYVINLYIRVVFFKKKKIKRIYDSFKILSVYFNINLVKVFPFD